MLDKKVKIDFSDWLQRGEVFSNLENKKINSELKKMGMEELWNVAPEVQEKIEWQVCDMLKGVSVKEYKSKIKASRFNIALFQVYAKMEWKYTKKIDGKWWRWSEGALNQLSKILIEKQLWTILDGVDKGDYETILKKKENVKIFQEFAREKWWYTKRIDGIWGRWSIQALKDYKASFAAEVLVKKEKLEYSELSEAKFTKFYGPKEDWFHELIKGESSESMRDDWRYKDFAKWYKAFEKWDYEAAISEFGNIDNLIAEYYQARVDAKFDDKWFVSDSDRDEYRAKLESKKGDMFKKMKAGAMMYTGIAMVKMWRNEDAVKAFDELWKFDSVHIWDNKKDMSRFGAAIIFRWIALANVWNYDGAIKEFKSIYPMVLEADEARQNLYVAMYNSWTKEAKSEAIKWMADYVENESGGRKLKSLQIMANMHQSEWMKNEMREIYKIIVKEYWNMKDNKYIAQAVKKANDYLNW